MNFPPPSARQARLIWLAVTGMAIGILVALSAGLIWGFGRVLQLLSPVLWPIAVAGVLAYLLDPVVDFFESRGMPRTRAIIAVFVLAMLILVALFSSVVPQVVRESGDLIQRVPAYAKQVETRVSNWATNPPVLLRRFLDHEAHPPAPASLETNRSGTLTTNPPASTPGMERADDTTPLLGLLDKGNLQTATGWLTKVLPRFGTWAFGQVGRVASWFGVLAGLALIPVYTFYFLVEKRAISSTWTDYLPVSDSRFKEEMVFVLTSINGYLISFFRGQVLVAVCDGILYGAGFLLIGLPYAVLIGAAAIGLTMIPFLGAIVTCIAALIIAVVQFGDWSHPLGVLAVFGVVQLLEGLVISPKIMGGRVGLHPVTFIIAVITGTTLLGGLLGGILAIPLTAALRVVMFRYIWKKRSPEEDRLELEAKGP